MVQKLAQESGKHVLQGQLLIKVCLCHTYGVGKVTVIEGLRKNKSGYLMEEFGERKLVRNKDLRSNSMLGCMLVTQSSLRNPRAVAHKAPLSMEFSRQEYWSGLPFPPPGDLPNPGLSLRLLCLLHCRQILYPHVVKQKTDSQQRRGLAHFKAIDLVFQKQFFELSPSTQVSRMSLKTVCTSIGKLIHLIF